MMYLLNIFYIMMYILNIYYYLLYTLRIFCTFTKFFYEVIFFFISFVKLHCFIERILEWFKSLVSKRSMARIRSNVAFRGSVRSRNDI